MSFLNLNKQFYNVLDELFQINKLQSWEEISKTITLEKISKTYEEYSKIFNHKIDRASLLPKNNPSEKLTSIFHGDLDGTTIINNIARHSCYTDEIIVLHPLQNPLITNPKMNPIEFPGLWQRDFINSLYFYIVIRKWVVSGIVHLIQSPIDYDYNATRYFWDLAKKRVSDRGFVIEDEEVKQEQELKLFQNFKYTLAGLSDEILIFNLKKLMPEKSDDEIDYFFKEIRQSEDSLPLKLDLPYNSKDGILNLNKSGGNLEHIDALCEMTGSYSFTTEKIIKRQLELRGTNSYWTKFSTLHSGVNLNYLNGVDVSFALQIREEDRLAGVRRSLREISTTIDSTDFNNIKETDILALNDNFKEAVKSSETEWEKINSDAKKHNILGAVATAFITEPTSIIVPAISLATSIGISEYFKQKGIKRYRNSNPFSVYVDLKNKKPSFLTDIKKCIF